MGKMREKKLPSILENDQAEATGVDRNFFPI